MKFAHIADLHIGKKLHDASLLADQEEALSSVAEAVRRTRPDCVFIARDVYDHPVPGADAVSLFDRFLTALTDSGTEVCIVGGNHDSQERLSFAGRILARQGVHIACLEEIAYINGFIDRDQLRARGKLFEKTAYGKYLLDIAEQAAPPSRRLI